MRLVALIILVRGSTSSSATVPSYAGFKFCIQKMRLVALIILVPGRASKSATVSIYEGLKVSHIKDAPRCTDHFGTWESL